MQHKANFSCFDPFIASFKIHHSGTNLLAGKTDNHDRYDYHEQILNNDKLCITSAAGKEFVREDFFHFHMKLFEVLKKESNGSSHGSRRRIQLQQWITQWCVSKLLQNDNVIFLPSSPILTLIINSVTTATKRSNLKSFGVIKTQSVIAKKLQSKSS